MNDDEEELEIGSYSSSLYFFNNLQLFNMVYLQDSRHRV